MIRRLNHGSQPSPDVFPVFFRQPKRTPTCFVTLPSECTSPRCFHSSREFRAVQIIPINQEDWYYFRNCSCAVTALLLVQEWFVDTQCTPKMDGLHTQPSDFDGDDMHHSWIVLQQAKNSGCDVITVIISGQSLHKLVGDQLG